MQHQIPRSEQLARQGENREFPNAARPFASSSSERYQVVVCRQHEHDVVRGENTDRRAPMPTVDTRSAAWTAASAARHVMSHVASRADCLRRGSPAASPTDRQAGQVWRCFTASIGLLHALGGRRHLRLSASGSWRSPQSPSALDLRLDAIELDDDESASACSFGSVESQLGVYETVLEGSGSSARRRQDGAAAAAISLFSHRHVLIAAARWCCAETDRNPSGS